MCLINIIGTYLAYFKERFLVPYIYRICFMNFTPSGFIPPYIVLHVVFNILQRVPSAGKDTRCTRFYVRNGLQYQTSSLEVYQKIRNQREMLGSLQGVDSSFGTHQTSLSPITRPKPSNKEETRAFVMRAEPVITAPSTTSVTPIVKFCPANHLIMHNLSVN